MRSMPSTHIIHISHTHTMIILTGHRDEHTRREEEKKKKKKLLSEQIFNYKLF